MDEVNELLEDLDERHESFGDPDDVRYAIRLSRLSEKEINSGCYVATDLDAVTSVRIRHDRDDLDYVVLRLDGIDNSSLGIREKEPVAYILSQEQNILN